MLSRSFWGGFQSEVSTRRTERRFIKQIVDNSVHAIGGLKNKTQRKDRIESLKIGAKCRKREGGGWPSVERRAEIAGRMVHMRESGLMMKMKSIFLNDSKF